MEDVKLLDKINRFLARDKNYGYGNGSGCGYGINLGHGSGYGSGIGVRDGDDYGFGYGNGSGCGGYGIDEIYGEGYGEGSGEGDGSGSGFGSGYGDGFGCDSMSVINGHTIFHVNDIATIFTSINGNVAKGFILKSDLTMTPCYVVKGNGLFAHGYDLHEAMEALNAGRRNHRS